MRDLMGVLAIARRSSQLPGGAKSVKLQFVVTLDDSRTYKEKAATFTDLYRFLIISYVQGSWGAEKRV
jgi:hypothetical protein